MNFLRKDPSPGDFESPSHPVISSQSCFVFFASMFGLSSWFFTSPHQSCQTITWESKLPQQAIKMSCPSKLKRKCVISVPLEAPTEPAICLSSLNGLDISKLVWGKTHREKDFCTLKSMSGLVSCWRASTNSWMTPPLSSNDFSLEHKQQFSRLSTWKAKVTEELYILLNKLPVPLTTCRLLKGVALSADHVRVDEGLWIAFCDLLYNLLNCCRLWFVKKSHHLTDPANQQPARHTDNLKWQQQQKEKKRKTVCSKYNTSRGDEWWGIAIEIFSFAKCIRYLQMPFSYSPK